MKKKKRMVVKKGFRHSTETKNKMKKSVTQKIIDERKVKLLVFHQKKFDDDFMKIKPMLIELINNGLDDNLIIKKIKNISKYRLKKK